MGSMENRYKVSQRLVMPGRQRAGIRVLPFFNRKRVQSHMERGNRRWLGRINSRGKNLERDWSQFLLPPHKSVIPVNAQGEVGTEPELPATFAGFPVGAVQQVFGGGAKFKDEKFDVLEAKVWWG